ncbi:Predicted DNA binding protein, contains HTH domain [Halogeometricum rufum]|uniref:Predicted DNA binding protein, contains HTH domain n=2 Tax=Halogeometricum rufum TaxID=553469 RepID=A0A1I6G1L2_9EURY|nr:Predicted DNA binding protein, contains HTH domain [Halogeometricum rufum]
MLRYATLSLSLPDGVREPTFDLFDDSPAVSTTATRYLGPTENGRHVGLSDVCGDLAVARDLLESDDDVLQYNVAGTDGRGVVYAHHRSVGPIKELLDILYRHDIVLEWPIDHRGRERDSAVQFTIVGTDEGIHRATTEIPDVVDVTVERVGGVESKAEAEPTLTDPQAALLDLAVEKGYYEVPRRTTQRALADHLDVAPGTVGDRLQRIERRVMTAYADRGDDW